MVGEPERVDSRAPRRARACAAIVSNAQRALARDRVVVLRQREPDAHPPTLRAVAGSSHAGPESPSACETSGRAYLGVLECVPNVSEGRDRVVLDALARGVRAVAARRARRRRPPPRPCSPSPDPGAADAETRGRARSPVRPSTRLDLADPRRACTRGSGCSTSSRSSRSTSRAAAAVEAARSFAAWVGDRARACRCSSTTTPTPRRRSLPELRARRVRHARAPTSGRRRPHPRLGAIAVGARPPLVARQLLARHRRPRGRPRGSPRAVRERDGGLPGVRALGLLLGVRGVAQVSMNLVDLARDRASRTACTEVRRAGRGDDGARSTRVELVGPAAGAPSWRAGADGVPGVGGPRRRRDDRGAASPAPSRGLTPPRAV